MLTKYAVSRTHGRIVDDSFLRSLIDENLIFVLEVPRFCETLSKISRKARMERMLKELEATVRLDREE